jgi:hypothetical protein
MRRREKLKGLGVVALAIALFASTVGAQAGRNGEFRVIDLGGGHKGEAALLQSLDTGDKVWIALRPEQVGVETTVSLPREGLWAYRDMGASSYE